MAIQKISAFTQAPYSSKIRRDRQSNLTSFGQTETNAQNSTTSKEASNAIKNSFLSNVSFKGHSKELVYHKMGTSGYYQLYEDKRTPVKVTSYYDSYGTSGYASMISSSKSFHPNSSIERLDNKNKYWTNRVYFADPEETVNAQTKKDHDYIVYDNRPKYPRLEDVKKSYFDATKNAVDYGQHFKTIAEYYSRLKKADKIELERLYEKKKPIEENYNKSLNYINLLNEKDKDLPWETPTISTEREEAEYYFSQNEKEFNAINQKIGYYNDRVNHSNAQIQKAVKAYEIFNEVGPKMFYRDEMNNKFKHAEWLIPYNMKRIEENNEKMQKIEENKEKLIHQINTAINWKVINEERVKSYLEQDYLYYSDRKELEKAKTECASLQEEIEKLQQKIKDTQAYLQRAKDENKRYSDEIDREKANLPHYQAEFAREAKVIESLYPKMEELYKSIEEWQFN